MPALLDGGKPEESQANGVRRWLPAVIEKPVIGVLLVGQPRADGVLQRLRLWT
jgi:hypothetical protein